jgi:uncharacterized protein with HEPN domain
MRDKLAHDYFGVDLDLVWDVVPPELPATRARIILLLERLNSDEDSGA